MSTALERKAGRVNRFIDHAKKRLKPAPSKKAPSKPQASKKSGKGPKFIGA